LKDYVVFFFSSPSEQELKGAADVIERCVAKLNAATQAARQRAAEKGIDIEEQNITEAILEAAQVNFDEISIISFRLLQKLLEL
jgi:hypothetical protein